MLKTKFNPPIQEDKRIIRTNILTKLESEINSRLIMVTAGAGYGKSTTISQWATNLKDDGVCVVWLSLDETDDDPVRFIKNLVVAIQSQIPSVLEDLAESLTSSYTSNINWAMTECINAIIDFCGESQREELKFVLVLDDYHLITREEIHDAIKFMIDYSPLAFKLIILSREIPQLPIDYYRAKNWLSEINTADLVFDIKEGRVFFENSLTFKHELSVRDNLTKRTEGWVAGMQLAALSIKQEEDIGKACEAFNGNHPYVMNYLIDQVLSGLSKNEILLLMVTSIVERFSVPLAITLMEPLTEGQEKSLENKNLILDEFKECEIKEFLAIQKRHFFITSLDYEGKWFRYHQLFRDVLQSQFMEWLNNPLNNPKEISLKKLHLLVSQWFTEHGYEIEGFQHAILSGDIDFAVRLLQAGTVPLLFRGVVGLAIKWFETLSIKELNQRPWLWTMYASAGLYVGKFANVEIRLKAAEKGLSKFENAIETGQTQLSLTLADIRIIKGHIASLRSIVCATQHDFEQAVIQARLALKYSDDDILTIQSTSNWSLGYAKLEDKDYISAYDYLSEAKLLSKDKGPKIIWLMSIIGLGKIKQYALSYEAALNIYQEVFDFKGHKGYPITCDAYLAKAHIRFAQGEIEEADDLLEIAIQLVAYIDRTDRKALCQIFKSQIFVARGNYHEAIKLLDQAEGYCRKEGYYHRLDEITRKKGYILLKIRNIHAVEVMLNFRYEESLDIQLKLINGHVKEAIDLLEARIKKAYENQWYEEVLEDLIRHALACYNHHDVDKAHKSLQKAVELSYLNNCTQSFIEAGPNMLKFLKESDLIQVYPEFIHRLIRCMEMIDKQARVEPLSPRELEVLILISQGCSNVAIANSLFLALSTVKGINQRIFGKLQVQSRTEAVAKSRQLGWIE